LENDSLKNIVWKDIYINDGINFYKLNNPIISADSIKGETMLISDFQGNEIKLLKQLKRNNEVELEFKKLIQSNINEARYYTYLAEFYQETNQNDKAMDTYKEILKIDPKNPVSLNPFAFET